MIAETAHGASGPRVRNTVKHVCVAGRIVASIVARLVNIPDIHCARRPAINNSGRNPGDTVIVIQRLIMGLAQIFGP